MGNFTDNLRNAYDQLYDSQKVAPNNLLKSVRSISEGEFSEGNLIPKYSFQNLVRPLFGKTGIKNNDIGGHPDFTHLKNTNNQEYSPIVTLFMDIENSTRLNLIYSPRDVQLIKNTFICAAIELVNSLDGHVHRIMGDAVMAFFGGKRKDAYSVTIDALNCASVLMYFVDRVIKPRLKEYGEQFGIRIGVDYGENVLWSFYGYPGGGEVTATSFNVDVASKLQHQAGKNKIMIGQNLQQFIDFPEILLEPKIRKKDNEFHEELYLLPNMTNNDGTPLNYKKYILKWENYLRNSVVAEKEAELFLNTNSKIPTLNTKIAIFTREEDGFESYYIPLSYNIPKGKWLRYTVTLPKELLFPYSIKFYVENHGNEARIANENKAHINGNHNSEYDESKIKELSKKDSYECIHHWEQTKYRGLHYMKIEIIKDGAIKYLSQYGIYIE